MEWLDSDPGAENSMKALSEATNAQRFEAAVKPVGYDEVTPEEKERIKDIHDFRSKVNGEKYALGGKAVPTVSLYGGERMHTKPIESEMFEELRALDPRTVLFDFEFVGDLFCARSGSVVV